jgi:hypothetical protein
VAETTIAPVAIPLDLEVLPGTGGGSTGVAVLGIAADGEPAVVVVDTPQPRLLAGPVFAEDATPVDLAVVAGHGPSGTVLATLGATSAFSAIVVLCDSVSGETLGTIPVP